MPHSLFDDATHDPNPIHEIVREFEKAFRSGTRPRLDDYLRSDAPERVALLVELIHSELELRLRSGEAARVAEYLERYPQLAERQDDVLALLETERRVRAQLGETLDAAEFEQAYPQFGPQVRGLFERPESIRPTIPGYEILEQIGSGGMAVVYRARQIKLDRIVALKLIQRTDEVTRARFLVEAGAVAAIKHPHVVQVFDFGDPCGHAIPGDGVHCWRLAGRFPREQPPPTGR